MGGVWNDFEFQVDGVAYDGVSVVVSIEDGSRETLSVKQALLLIHQKNRDKIPGIIAERLALAKQQAHLSDQQAVSGEDGDESVRDQPK